MDKTTFTVHTLGSKEVGSRNAQLNVETADDFNPAAEAWVILGFLNGEVPPVILVELARIMKTLEITERWLKREELYLHKG